MLHISFDNREFEQMENCAHLFLFFNLKKISYYSYVIKRQLPKTTVYAGLILAVLNICGCLIVLAHKIWFSFDYLWSLSLIALKTWKNMVSAVLSLAEYFENATSRIIRKTCVVFVHKLRQIRTC